MARRAKERRWRIRITSDTSDITDCEDSGVQLDEGLLPGDEIDTVIQQLSNPRAHIHKDTWYERRENRCSVSPSISRKSILSTTSSERSISPSIDSIKSSPNSVSPSSYKKTFSLSAISPSRVLSKSISPCASPLSYLKLSHAKRTSSPIFLQSPTSSNNSPLSSPRGGYVKTAEVFHYPAMQTPVSQASKESLDDPDKILNQRQQKEYKRSLAKDLRKKCNVLLGRGNSSDAAIKPASKQSRKSVDSIEFHAHNKTGRGRTRESVASDIVYISKPEDETPPTTVTDKNESVAIKENSSPSSMKVIFTFDSGQEDSDDGITSQVIFSARNDFATTYKGGKSPTNALKRSCSVGYSKGVAPSVLRRHCPRWIAEKRLNMTNRTVRLSSSESSLPKKFFSSPSLDTVQDDTKVTPRLKLRSERAGTLDVPVDSDSLSTESVSPNATTPTTRSKFKLPRNVKKKFMFLRRRHTDTSLVDKLEQLEDANKKTDVSSSQVAGWRSSFSALLGDPAGLSMFQAFLRSEFSEENINFWIVCQDFKNLRHDNLRIAAQKIYYEYIAVAAPMEINLDSVTRLETKATLENPTTTMFNRAQRRIEALMEKDSYPRFLQSTLLLSLSTRR